MFKPKFNHRRQIGSIVKRLGLAPNGDVAKRWIELSKAAGRAHERSFHERLDADETFRAEFGRKVDAVIRAVATQLQDHYVALTRRAKEIAEMPPAQGVKILRNEIPGARSSSILQKRAGDVAAVPRTGRIARRAAPG
ncbi:hypothetical protein HU675_0049550 (plasmid) [Bradyrhizobium septentrionale]|uniref:Uncharacterized protein n=1 Tax=Bradyrhizobium septentrionale TaxID=1404411 RepID=A0A973WA10_9BRAD|nr:MULTISPECIES: hypothetical protein [Bradyrhizobium]MCK7664833.1 hypothetical protein [Bradyrhizobium sp. 2S1]UGY30325.1 hypothetical protein HU675_0049550 [Bradyrhizobium septentrionale]